MSLTMFDCVSAISGSWINITKVFITEVRYQRLETARTVKAGDALAFSSKAICAHVTTEANATVVITPAMQLAIDAGIAKGIAAALHAYHRTSKPGSENYFCFAHHDNKMHNTENCDFLRGKGFTMVSHKKMFAMRKPGTTTNGEVRVVKKFSNEPLNRFQPQ